MPSCWIHFAFCFFFHKQNLSQISFHKYRLLSSLNYSVHESLPCFNLKQALVLPEAKL
ncbi:mCG147405 [Mus musculus]|nr:mCG147405 [Mus musculus]